MPILDWLDQINARSIETDPINPKTISKTKATKPPAMFSVTLAGAINPIKL